MQFAPLVPAEGGGVRAEPLHRKEDSEAKRKLRLSGAAAAERPPSAADAARSLLDGGGAATVLSAIEATRRAFGPGAALEVLLDKRSFEPWEREAVARLVIEQGGCTVRS